MPRCINKTISHTHYGKKPNTNNTLKRNSHHEGLSVKYCHDSESNVIRPIFFNVQTKNANYKPMYAT